jgi:transcriptional regulator of acetoin/glycerol metabolism
MSLSEWDRALARERERFLSSGAAPTAVRDEISSSWRRCVGWSVPTGAIMPRYEPDVNSECRLLRASGPVLDTVVERLGELDISFIVTDAEARVLDRRVGMGALLRSLDAVNVTPGHVYAEDVVGTNGLGTAIELGRTARVDGHEHFVEPLVRFTCVGVPIADPFGAAPLGVIDVTCAADAHNKLVTLIAEQTARAVYARLVEQRSVHERALLGHFLAVVRRTHAGVVVVSDRIIMSNPQAARLLDGVEQALVWDHAARGLGDPPAWGLLRLADGQLARTKVVALQDGPEIIGALMEIRPTAGPAVEAPARPVRVDRRPPDLVGADQRCLDAYRLAHQALGTRPVVVCGEAGVGKTALARALHGRGPLVEMDAGAVVLDGGPAWLERLRTGLAGPVPGTLVVRHVPLLPDDVAGRVAAAMRTALDRGWCCVATATRGGGQDGLVLPELDALQVTLPPLRHRIADLPELVAAFAAPRRIAPEAVQLLMRLSWPGNLRELRSVVTQMLAALPVGTPGLAQVPAEVRRAAPRRRLTRFEQAEVHAILDALTETGGNKKDAARLLGISRSTLYRKLQGAGIDLENTLF